MGWYSKAKSYVSRKKTTSTPKPVATKQYSNIVLPAGNYKALKVVIGEGTGKNWWCVMFPPLCFVDIDNGITGEKTEDNLKKVLNDKEYNMIAEQGSKRVENIQLKFKIIEVIQNLKQTLQFL